jgi:hypothetical protein
MLVSARNVCGIFKTNLLENVRVSVLCTIVAMYWYVIATVDQSLIAVGARSERCVLSYTLIVGSNVT